MFRKYWLTTLSVVVLALMVTAFYTMGQKKIYQAVATVMFDPNPPRPLGTQVEGVVDMSSNSYWGNQEYYGTQYEIIQSRSVALSVVRELGLHNDPAFLGNLPPGEEPLSTEGSTPEEAAEALRARLSVHPVRDSRIATIVLKDADPERAQRLLSTLVETYVQMNLDRAINSTSAATDWLRSQLSGLQRDLDTSEHALHEYKKSNDILSVAFDDKSSMLVDQMRLLNAEIAATSSELGKVSSRYGTLKSASEADPMTVESTTLLDSSTLSSLRKDYYDALKFHQSLLDGPKGKNHPEVRNAKVKVESTKKAVLKEIRNIKRAARRDVTGVAGHLGGLKADLTKAKKQAHELNLLEIEYNNLRRSKENTEKLYSLVLERTKEADLTQMMRVNNISIVDAPLKPRGHVSPRLSVNLALGSFLGLLLGVAAAFARALFDRTVKVPADIEQEVGLSCLGLLPEMTKATQGPAYYARRRGRTQPSEEDGVQELVVHNRPLSSTAEAARTIRTNLMFMSPDNPHEVLLVTSAGPSEGKTTVACCIAVAMAQSGQSVALIDCDLRRPRLHRVFKSGNDEGVTTALIDGAFDSVGNETVVPDLSLTTSGPIPPNPAELLHTESFKNFLAAMRERYDRVIIDSPPVAAVTDPAILSTQVDATVLVVRAFKTKKDLARHAARSIQSVGGVIAGVVLNAVDFSRTEYKGSHYYYYDREGYYTSKEGDAGDRTSRKPRRRSEDRPNA